MNAWDRRVGGITAILLIATSTIACIMYVIGAMSQDTNGLIMVLAGDVVFFVCAKLVNLVLETWPR